MNKSQDTIEILPRDRHAELPPRLHHVQRRILGVEVLRLLVATSALTLALGLALLVTGNTIAGIALLAIAAVLCASLGFGIKQEPDSEVARASSRATGRARSRGQMLAVTIGAWSRSSLVLARARARELRLRRRLRNQLAPLGEAVYHERPERAEAIKAQMAALERELLESRREAATAVGAARTVTERERALVEPTEALPPLRRDGSEH